MIQVVNCTPVKECFFVTQVVDYFSNEGMLVCDSSGRLYSGEGMLVCDSSGRLNPGEGMLVCDLSGIPFFR